MRFSLRGNLLLIALLAAWPMIGSFIAPSILVASFATVLLSPFLKSSARSAFKISLAVFLATTTLYLSFGPAAWLMAQYIAPDSTAPGFVQEFCHRSFEYLFAPIATNFIFAPEPIRQLAFEYIQWWMPSSIQFRDMDLGIGWSRGPNSYTMINYQ